MNYESTSSHKLNEMSFREKAYRYRCFLRPRASMRCRYAKRPDA